MRLSLFASYFSAFIKVLILSCSAGLAFSALANDESTSQEVSKMQLQAVGHYEVVEEDFVYARVGDLELLARSYRPKKDGRLPALVEVHGGAWNLYDRTAGELYNKALASAGIYVLAIDFRQGPDFQHPLGSRDTTAAVRYLRAHADELNIDSSSIGLVGSSSGGHLALLAALKPNQDLHKGTLIVSNSASSAGQSSGDQAIDVDELSAEVAYVVALWPVSDPSYRYDYAKRVGRDALVKMHDGYFGNQENMRAASIARILNEKEATENLPQVLIVQAGEDGNIPREMTFDVMAAFQNAGSKIDYAFYPGMPHAFGHRPSEYTDDLIVTMRDFIARQLK
ncbi:alpha/beta hydrolase [Aurantivibrio infirmus]